jgi:hypothetical protein
MAVDEVLHLDSGRALAYVKCATCKAIDEEVVSAGDEYSPRLKLILEVIRLRREELLDFAEIQRRLGIKGAGSVYRSWTRPQPHPSQEGPHAPA